MTKVFDTSTIQGLKAVERYKNTLNNRYDRVTVTAIGLTRVQISGSNPVGHDPANRGQAPDCTPLVRRTKVMNNNEMLTPFGEQMRDFENIYKEKKVKTTGWKAKSMPIVFWSVPTKDWTDNPRIAEGIEAEVTLPNGQIVVVDEIRYQGINDGNHHWQGSLSRSGKASAYHTAFNCVPCGTNTCRLPQNKRLEAVLGRES